MKAGKAILISLGILVIAIIAGMFRPEGPYIVILITALWAAIDAYRIGLSKYKVGGPTGPVITFLGCVLLWILVFPWYLINKGKIARGEAVLKNPVK